MMRSAFTGYRLFVAMALCCSFARADGAKPNIVYLLADDLGYGDVHCLNPRRGRIQTPHLDRLASQGMSFTDSHSGSSVCTPTRYGILTGRYAWRSRLQHGVLDGYVEPLIAKDLLTVPRLLKSSGYHTACFGKWHLGFTVEGAGRKEDGAGRLMGAPVGAVTRDGPLTRGFDEFFGFHHARMMRSVFANDRVAELVEPVDMLPRLVKRTREFVAARAGAPEPFFLYVALNAPHTPIVPSRAWQGQSGLGDYGDFVMETDWAVGEVLASLDRAGIAGHTLVIFTSDNGCSPAAGVTRLQKQGHFPSADFRGYKADLWDGGHRVPFLVRWPGVVKPGSSCSRLVCHTDLMATAAEIAGARMPDDAGVDSFSFLPLLRGEDRPVRETIVHHSISGRFAIREADWKLELCAGSGGWSEPGEKDAGKQGLPPVQLYDLSRDPGEAHNVGAEHRDRVEQMTAALETIVNRGRSTAGPALKNDVAVDLHKRTAKTGEKE